jgi:hypothetical protein
MIEFMRGIRTPLLTIVSPASASTASKAAVNLESRSRIRNLAFLPACAVPKLIVKAPTWAFT